MKIRLPFKRRHLETQASIFRRSHRHPITPCPSPNYNLSITLSHLACHLITPRPSLHHYPTHSPNRPDSSPNYILLITPLQLVNLVLTPPITSSHLAHQPITHCPSPQHNPPIIPSHLIMSNSQPITPRPSPHHCSIHYPIILRLSPHHCH